MPPPQGMPRPPAGPAPPAAPAPPSGPPPPGDHDAKRARTDFVLQAEDEFLDAHPGHSKVGVMLLSSTSTVSGVSIFHLSARAGAASPGACERFHC